MRHAARHYIYRGDRMTDPHLVGKSCSAVLTPEGKCVRGRGSMLVQFHGEEPHPRVVIARRLRRMDDLAKHSPAWQRVEHALTDPHSPFSVDPKRWHTVYMRDIDIDTLRQAISAALHIPTPTAQPLPGESALLGMTLLVSDALPSFWFALESNESLAYFSPRGLEFGPIAKHTPYPALTP